MEELLKNSRVVKGIGASEGIVTGKVFLIERERVIIPHKGLPDNCLDEEIERFQEAVQRTKQELNRIKTQVLALEDREPVFIIDAHLMILEDDMLIGATIDNIGNLKINAEWALRKVLDQVIASFEKMSDPYLRGRGSDIDLIGERILRELIGDSHDLGFDKMDEPMIVVAHDLSPAETAQMAFHMVMGFATDIGSRTSHTALVAKSLRIPAVVGLGQITSEVDHGDTLIVDGANGVVIINPSEEVSNEYAIRHSHIEYVNLELKKYVELPSETLDGHSITLAANLEILEETKFLAESGAQGVGLYRTEYLYLNRPDLPTEDEHYQNYKQLIEAVAPHSATIRTMDLGGDKFSLSMGHAEELNPALGLRAIRLSFRSPEIFRTQLRGILRASIHGKARIMFPMISSYQEMDQAKTIFAEVQADLDREGIPYDQDVEVGIMIEVPSAALMADHLAREVDFFSIGTNDLIQYVIAADRGNELVSYMYQPLHPAILRIIRAVVWAAHEAGIRVDMCGEMASDPMLLPVLLGLGLDELSMPTNSILRVKKIVRAINKSDADAMTKEMFNLKTQAQLRKLLEQEINTRWQEAYTLPEKK